MNKNLKDVRIIGRLKLKVIKAKGIRIVISMSKIRKIKLIIKNWILKGRRWLDIGSNPHSNGDIFSRLLKDFFDKIRFNKNNKIEIIIKINISLNKK